MFVRRSPASELVRPSIRSAIRAGRRLGWRWLAKTQLPNFGGEASCGGDVRRFAAARRQCSVD